jgi:LmbE family N-acetylglucosaminyl deacetylase
MNVFNPSRHLKAGLRRHLKAGGKLHSHRLAYYALRSAIRAQGPQVTAEYQKDGLIQHFGHVQAHALFMAACSK